MSRARNLAGFATAIYPVNNITVGFVTASGINVTGVATFGSIDLTGGVSYADVAGIATVAEGLTGNPAITVSEVDVGSITSPAGGVQIDTGDIQIRTDSRSAGYPGVMIYRGGNSNSDRVGGFRADGYLIASQGEINGDLEIDGSVSVGGSITAGTLYGDGSNLTGVEGGGGGGLGQPVVGDNTDTFNSVGLVTTYNESIVFNDSNCGVGSHYITVIEPILIIEDSGSITVEDDKTLVLDPIEFGQWTA